METKSRYEVIANLEDKKRELIRERDGLQEEVKKKEFELKQIRRHLEDKEEDLNNFKKSLEEKKSTINELIKGVEDSLERFAKLQEKKS